MSTISERFLQLRGNMGQGKLARLLGINPNTLRSYENARSIPNQQVLERVCQRCGISPTWLVLGKGEMMDPSARPVQAGLNGEAAAQGSLEAAGDALQPDPDKPWLEVQSRDAGSDPYSALLKTLQEERQEERQERRALASDNRRLYEENAALLRENGELRERLARLEALQGSEDEEYEEDV